MKEENDTRCCVLSLTNRKIITHKLIRPMGLLD